MIAGEEKAQNDALDEALAKRRAKKMQLRDLVDTLSEKKGQVDDYFTKKMDEIADQETSELQRIEPEIAHERIRFLKAINQRLDQKRSEILGESEQRLNEFRKKAGPNEEYQFADMIAQYGEQVKQVDAQIEREREQERRQMEEELARRKAERIERAKAKRKQREEELVKEVGGTRSAKQDEMNAILGLIKPIADEENKINRVLRDIQSDVAVVKPEGFDLNTLLSADAKAAEAELSKNDNK